MSDGTAPVGRLSSGEQRALASFLAVADHVGAPADAPVESRIAAAADYLKLRDYSPMQILELRLDAARGAAAATPHSDPPS